MIKPVILAGGFGTRLWPLSRESYPKQLLKLTGDHSLLQETVLRAGQLAENEPIVITNETYRFLVASQLQEIGSHPEIILEPFGKNTAPAVAIAALLVLESNPVLMIMPSDHYIPEREKFCKAVLKALPLAEQGKIVCFGLQPTRADTGYGYIKHGTGDDIAYTIEKFIEKPDEEKARQFFEEGYLWNSGIFLVKASVYLDVLLSFEKEMVQVCQKAVEQLEKDVDFLRIEPENFSRCPSRSIDYAIMEKTDRAVVAPLKISWTDLGSWNALYEVLNKDENGNVIKGHVYCENVKNSYLYSEERFIAAIGICDQIVVETEDAILIADKAHAQELKETIEKLKEHKIPALHSHQITYRPWGSYKTIDTGERFQVKRIIVKPGGKLSLQMHHHRSEHWTIVRGTAKISLGKEEVILTENQSTYIPAGTLHRLENPGMIDLELIEVQTGAYLSEDDIVRFQDEYGRLIQG